MLRLILLAVLFLLVLGGVLAVELYHFFGWKGMLPFPFIVLALIWVGKIFIGKLIKLFALGLFSMKSGVLRGAGMTVHSIASVPKPSEFNDAHEYEEADAHKHHNETDAKDSCAEELQEEEVDDEKPEPAEPEKPRNYYTVELTITPREGGGDRVWEPGEFILTSERIKSLADLEDGEKEVGATHEVQVWDGSKFGPDDPGKYPGQQRLKVTFAIVPGTSKAWLQYYNETIGSLELPPWQPTA